MVWALLIGSELLAARAPARALLVRTAAVGLPQRPPGPTSSGCLWTADWPRTGRWASSASDSGGGDKASGLVSGRSVSPITRQLWEKRQQMESLIRAQGESGLEPKEQTEFPPKRADFVSVTFPFGEDKNLVEQYRNPWGYVRLGKILEDLDSLAGNVAYTHCDDDNPTTVPAMLVTAGVEKIALKRQLRLDRNMTLGGRVVWTGKSSMDIRMEVIDADGEDCLVAHFFFVARSTLTGKSMRVSPLELVSREEQEMHDDGDRRAALRKAKAKARTDGAAPQAMEEWIERTIQQSQTAMDMPTLVPSGWAWLRDTAHENILMCQPQQRNMSGRIFGGFLMRRAFELAFATCYSFAGSRPAFLLVDDISFRRPVDVGDLLRLKSAVLHVEHKYNPGPPWLRSKSSHAVVHIEVTALVVRPEEPSSQVTNNFQFRFAVDNSIRQLKNILPHTRDEAHQMYLAAAQHHSQS